jgi:LDH2 family malate/lactate/ureidoglycolate dehydrogenase
VISDTKRQEKYKENTFTIVKELPGMMQLDCNHLPISFKLKWIHDMLIAKAKQNGIAIVSVNNSGGMHSLNTWAQGLAKRGVFAFGAYNGGPDSVVPYNGTKGIFGTNPITFGFPSKDGGLVVDMATSEIPYFEIRNAKKNGISLKPNVAVDENGVMTTDTARAMDETGTSNLLPMGGSYKGYAINYLIEIMTGSLIGAKLSNMQNPDYINEDHGGFLIVIDIDAFTTRERFESEVAVLNTIIREQKPATGSTKVIVPGDNNLERLHAVQESESVEIDEAILNDLKGLAV